jgi:hypothetical protein
MVTLVDRAILVSFCSNHDSGTALPPPSVGGLRRKGPVTWPFALPRRARSRRPRAVPAAMGQARRRARARARIPPGRRIFSSCPCSPPSFAARKASLGRRPSLAFDHPAQGSLRGPPRPSPTPWSPSLAVRASFTGLRLLRARLRREVPGFGPSRSLIRPASVTVAPTVPRISARLPSRRPVARQPSPSGACLRPSGGSPSRLQVVCSMLSAAGPHSAPPDSAFAPRLVPGARRGQSFWGVEKTWSPAQKRGPGRDRAPRWDRLGPDSV